jgi:plasmid stability protein
MPTLTIRNLSPKTVRSLKQLAERNHRSMEQEVRDLIAAHVGDRLSAIEQIEAAWKRQRRSPTPQEVDEWIATGRA